LPKLEQWLAAQNVRSAWLLTEAGPGALLFYEKRGWRKEGRQQDGQIRFVKRLDDAGATT